MNWNEDNLPPPPAKSNVGVYLCIAALFVGTYLGYRAYSAKNPAHLENEGILHPAVGKKLDELNFEPLLFATEPITSEQLRGKVALVNFWGTWCPPCRVEFPHLVTLQQDFATEKDFQFISVSVTSDGSDEAKVKEPTEKFLLQQRAKFPVYFDPNAAARRAILQQAEISPREFGYPATILLDREGIIRGVWVGFFPGMERHLTDTVRKTLAAKNNAVADERQMP